MESFNTKGSATLVYPDSIQRASLRRCSSFPSRDLNDHHLASPTPFFEDHETPTPDVLYPLLASYDYDQANALYYIQQCYFCGYLEEALEKSSELIKEGERSAALMARLTHMITTLALGNSKDAHKDIQIIHDECMKGLAQSEDTKYYEASVVCSMRIESVLMADILDHPPYEKGIDMVPSGLKTYIGFLSALKEIRHAKYQKAEGIAYAFNALIGDNYPFSKTILHLLLCSTAMFEGECDRALDEFDAAWKVASKHGIIMPFVEMYFILLGVPRKYFDMVDFQMGKKIELMVRTYRKGWFGLRGLCGFEDPGISLTPLEDNVVALVALGWRNKEIAQHLDISENTVKHKLTSVYQKTGATKRSEVRAFMERQNSFGRVSL